MSLLNSIYTRLRGLISEVLKFGIVGAIAFVVDVGLFNLLSAAYDKPLTAKTVSVVAATAVAYLGNRFWTFRHRASRGVSRETLLFVGFNAAALVMALGCLGISHYVLGFTSQLADNIAANVVGLSLGTLFRFWSYRTFVFPSAAPVAVPVVAPVPAAVIAAVAVPSTLIPAVTPAMAQGMTERKPTPVAA